MRRVHDVGRDGVGIAEREGLHALNVAGLRGDQDVGRREVRRELVAVDEVPAVDVLLGADGVIDPGDELVVGEQVRDGVADKPAVVRIDSRIGYGQVFLQRQRRRAVGRRGRILVSRQRRAGERVDQRDGLAG